MEKAYLVLDIGTSYIKCGCIDSGLNLLAVHQEVFPMLQSESKYELDFNLFFSKADKLLKKCLSETAVKSFEIEALLITSQAQTFTAVDKNFQPLCNGLVWLDERAKEEAEYLSENLPDFSASSGFAFPLPSLYISKLLWLKSNSPSVYKQAEAFPLVNEFLVKKLTGKFFTDTTSFGMSGMYDFRTESLNKSLLKILELRKNHFPFIADAAAKGELITDEIKNNWNVKNKFPVYLCGNDQGASACGAGLKEPGDLNINFGTAMVFYSVTEKFLTTNLTNTQIAGKHPLGKNYFLLNFESDYGLQIRLLKEKFFKNDSYDELFQTYKMFPDVQEQKPNIHLNKNFTPIQARKYTAGVIKFYLKELKIHLQQIEELVPIKKIMLSGGMMKSEVWVDILSNNIKMPFTLTNRAEAGLLGAINIYLYNKEKN